MRGLDPRIHQCRSTHAMNCRSSSTTTNGMLALARMAEFVGEFWLDLIAVAQRGAGIGDDGVAFAHALADLDVLVGMKADAHAPRLDGAVAHYLHAGALGLVEDGGIRHRDAAAAAGIDGGAG